MSKLLEIFGKGIAVNTVELIWHWLDQCLPQTAMSDCDKERLGAVMEHIANHEMVLAQEKLGAYLQNAPDCCCGRMAAAAICLRNNLPADALEQAQSVYYRQPSNTMAMYVMGYCLERLGRAVEAVDFYQDCLKFKRHLQLPRQRLAAIRMRSGQLDQAIREYELLTGEHPDDIASIVLLGYLYCAAGQYEQAIETFNLAIVSHPDNFFELRQDDDIESLVQNGMMDQALEKIHWMIEQVGPMPDLIVRMADVYARGGRDAEAIACYENAIRVQPNSLEAIIKLGTHYLRSRRFALAAEQFNQAAEINDDIVDAYIGLATSYKLCGQTDQAARTLSLAISIQQNSTLLFSEAATLHFQAILDESKPSETHGDKVIVLINDVIRAHQEQMRHHQSRADVHYKYGILMMVENNYEKAIEAFEKTIQLNPIHYRAANKLCLCLFDNGQVDAAMDYLSRPQTPSASMLESYYRTAILFCDKPAFTKALQKIQTRIGETIENTDIHINLETVLENLGLVDRAFTNWQRMIETAENLPTAKQR